MTSATPGTELLEALRLLEVSARELRAEVERPLVSNENRLQRLSEVIVGLGRAKAAQVVRCPPEYGKQWDELVLGSRTAIDPRAIRYLCWNAEIATSQTFQHFLDREQPTLNARSLQGLVRCCHARWSAQFASSQIVTRVRDRVDRYAGSNRLLQSWKSNLTVILGPDAHDEFGGELLKQTIGVRRFCESWGILGEASRFVGMAIESASQSCLEQTDRVPRMRDFLFRELIPWPGWPAESLTKVMSRLILLPTTRSPELVESITRLVLSDRRFGDPRLRQNLNNWIGMDEAARRIKEWLSAADISFFFEHVLPKGKDPHGRKSFWLRYVGSRGLVSRPLLNELDKIRLRQILRDKKEQVSHFGEIDGNTSAFLLDFGPILVIEFSSVGNACYIYDKRAGAEIVPDLWAPVTFRVPDLKRQNSAVARVIHNKPKYAWQRDLWQNEMEGILARYGIRAVS
jgi:EH signature protein